MPICQRCAKDSDNIYTVSLRIINQQSQDTVYNDSKDFCQYCTNLINTISDICIIKKKMLIINDLVPD